MICVYSSGDSSAVVVAVCFGFLGYFLRKMDFDLGLLILAYVLLPILERSLRQALTISVGDLSIFWQYSLTVGLLFFRGGLPRARPDAAGSCRCGTIDSP